MLIYSYSQPEGEYYYDYKNHRLSGHHYGDPGHRCYLRGSTGQGHQRRIRRRIGGGPEREAEHGLLGFPTNQRLCTLVFYCLDIFQTTQDPFLTLAKYWLYVIIYLV